MKNAQYYVQWMRNSRLGADAGASGEESMENLPTPDERGLFRRGSLFCLLPYLRVYCKPEVVAASGGESPEADGAGDDRPCWKPDSWQSVNPADPNPKIRSARPHESDGFVRYMRADQLLDCLLELVCEGDAERFAAELRSLMRVCLIPVDEASNSRLDVLDRRVETIRLIERRSGWRFSRDVGGFPNAVRLAVDSGIDVVHTPENHRAGLTRYLCNGWEIDEGGKLSAADGASLWGPATSRIPFALHDSPRRLMLGAALVSRAVSLVDTGEAPDAREATECPTAGRRLRASFTVLGGLTHEDAIVISQTAASKLGCRTARRVRVLVPAMAARVEVVEEGAEVRAGQPLARAYIDAFALGLKLREANRQEAPDGWIEVGLPGVRSPFGGVVDHVSRRVLRTPRWRELITIEIVREAPARIGDKLSTWHGIKGIISAILPDDEMPETGRDRAEIVLSPLGIIRRKAMGQLREASEPGSSEIARHGFVIVMRQPQDADLPERCRVRGADAQGAHLQKGQRYGEMEFWALMAHGAAKVARELLSAGRSTAKWMEMEARIEEGDSRALAARALNRFLAVAGVRVEQGRLVALNGEQHQVENDSAFAQALARALVHQDFDVEGHSAGDVSDTRAGVQPRPAPEPVDQSQPDERDDDALPPADLKVSASGAKARKAAAKLLECLDNREYFRNLGGSARLPLGERVRVVISTKPTGAFERNERRALGRALPLGLLVPIVRRKLGNGESEVDFALDESGRVKFRPGDRVVGYGLDLDSLEVVPPWLRPSSVTERHPLTRAYSRLLSKLAVPYWEKVEWKGRMAEPISSLVADCVKLALDSSVGAGGFLRREVLGRRLTRSARAVVVPRPDLRIDEIAIPGWMADRLFDGLDDGQPRLVLVNRNPTLHRRGLLALRPVVEDSDGYSSVFGLPLGVLRAMNADFDGDQVSVVVLETSEAIEEAEAKLLPGSAILRHDPWRSMSPSFPFAGELSDPAREKALAADSDASQDEWCNAHAKLQEEKLDGLGDGWGHPIVAEATRSPKADWDGRTEVEWRELAVPEMEKILRGVRRKGRLGGVLRAELYRRAFVDADSFFRSVQAIQAVTERLTQTALSSKRGEGAARFNARAYFADPRGSMHLLASLDEEADKADEPLDAELLASHLGDREDLQALTGLLRWMARPEDPPLPDCDGLMGESGKTRRRRGADPRISWFL